MLGGVKECDNKILTAGKWENMPVGEQLCSLGGEYCKVNGIERKWTVTMVFLVAYVDVFKST